ncbi:MAG: hypothetical protein V3S47_01950 [Acidobacteriota bacterium]
MGRSRMSLVKRQRELKKAEKAAQKRAKRHGIPEVAFIEPQPTVRVSVQDESPDSTEAADSQDSQDETNEAESG